MKRRCHLVAIHVLISVGLVMVLAAAQKEPASDEKNIIGGWRGGWPDEKKPSYEIEITEKRISAKNLTTEKSEGEGTYQIDTKKKTIDATRTVDPQKGTTFLGIYNLDGDTLKWCSNNGTKKRPTELVNKPGNDHYLLVLKREK